MDRLVPALFGTDRPRAAGISRASLSSVIRSLAEAAPDRMDWWQIQHVKTHIRDIRQVALDILERAMRARLGGERTRKELVPGAVARPHAIDRHAQLLFVGRRKMPLGMAIHQRCQIRRERLLGCPTPA